MQILTQTVGHDAVLTAYVQEPSAELTTAATRPAVLVLPGGGYFFTSDREAEPVALAYLAEGFNAFVLRYAVGPENPFEKSFDDAKAALAWIRENADVLHIDPAKVAVVGFSAGGHLACSLATAAEDKPDALVACYPVTLEEFGPPVGKEIVDVPSHVSADTPPTFLFSTCDDTVVPIRNSIAFLAALAEHGVPFESHIYLLGPHGLSLATAATANGQAPMVEPSVAQWLRESVRFLRAVFGDFAVEGEQESFSTLANRRRLGLDMPLGRLMTDERAADAVRRHAPALAAALQRDAFAGAMSVRQILGLNPEAISPESAEALGDELAALRQPPSAGLRDRC
ncbi:alpha/beta hydrolase [Tessaracoccus sp. G1721]